jgi:hypothetical protein
LATEPAEQLYHRLRVMYVEAVDAGRYELGYHLLAAALHAAEELDSLELLTQVTQLAEQQQRKLDAMKPEHRLSSNAARRRGNSAQYAALVAISSAARGRISADRTLRRSRNARESRD